MSTAAISFPRRAAHAIVRRPEWRQALGLVWVLSAKNVKVRYKRTSLGMVWSIAQPLIQATVLTFVIARVFHITAIPHYGLFVLSGVMPYSAVSSGLQSATVSVVDNAGLLKKVAIPRLVFPVAAVGGGLIIFGAGLLVLIFISATQGELGPNAVLLVPGIALVLLIATAVGIFGAALYVKFRDVRFLIESGMQLLFYATPVLYTPEKLGRLAPWLRLNPITGILSIFRGAVAGFRVDWAAVLCTVVFGFVLLVLAVILFNRRAQTFADLT